MVSQPYPVRCSSNANHCLLIFFFLQFWRNVANTNGDTLEAAKLKLKERLLETVRSTSRGVSTSEEQRQDIEELIAALEPCEY